MNQQPNTQTPAWASGASGFLRSIHQTPGTVLLANGRSFRGWVTHVDSDHFHLLLARDGESPTSGRDIGPDDDDPYLLIREEQVAAWEYAGEDSWGGWSA